MNPSNAAARIPGLDSISVRNIYCIGRNYAEHARELGNAVPTEPVVFLKPNSAVIGDGADIIIPAMSQRVDHEVELVVAIGKGGRRISESEALSSVAGIGIGIDVTARDLQDQAKKKALPWAIAKGFDTFAVLGGFAPVPTGVALESLSLELLVNGEKRQDGRIVDMLFSVPKLIAFLSGIFTLQPGDLIYTGTPPGVAPLAAGDRVQAQLLSPQGQVLSQVQVGVGTEHRV